MMVSPYQVGRMPRASRSNNETPNASSRSLSNFDAAGCDTFRTSAARCMLPSSPIAVININWRVLRRARRNQGVGADICSGLAGYINHDITLTIKSICSVYPRLARSTEGREGGYALVTIQKL